MVLQLCDWHDVPDVSEADGCVSVSDFRQRVHLVGCAAEILHARDARERHVRDCAKGRQRLSIASS